jgi:hypothetical protein
MERRIRRPRTVTGWVAAVAVLWIVVGCGGYAYDVYQPLPATQQDGAYTTSLERSVRAAVGSGYTLEYFREPLERVDPGSVFLSIRNGGWRRVTTACARSVDHPGFAVCMPFIFDTSGYNSVRTWTLDPAEVARKTAWVGVVDAVPADRKGALLETCAVLWPYGPMASDGQYIEDILPLEEPGAHNVTPTPPGVAWQDGLRVIWGSGDRLAGGGEALYWNTAKSAWVRGE